MSPRPQLVLDRYRLGPMLGRGATSTVRRATDVRADREVAVKTVPADPELLARTGVEIRAAQRLDHPGIVRLLDWGEGDDCVHLVWELVDGPNLKEALPPEGAADGWCFARMSEVVECLAHAHARGVVHRDVKPANVLLDPRGHARLSDFGVARLADERGLTVAGSLVGTVAYMAPEQARGQPVGPATDVYAACLVLYELLTGGNPLNHRSPVEAARRAAAAELPPLAEVRPDLPARAVAVVEAGLRLDPARRPPAARMAEAMRDLAIELTPAARRGAATRRMLPVAVPAALWAALAVAALSAWSPAGGLEIAIGAGAVFGAAAKWPRAGALLMVAGGAVLLGRQSAGAGVLLGLVATLGVAAGIRWPRLLPLPALAPVAAAVGLLPLALAGVAGLRTWPQRVWAAASGTALTLGWQLWTGGAGTLLGPNPGRPGQAALTGEGNPFRVLDVLWAQIHEPWVAWQALALMTAALAAQLLGRAPAGAPRAIAAGVWSAALLVACVAVTPDPAHVVAAVIPSAMLIAVWALRPWRTLARLGGEPASATLRGPV